MSIGFSNLSRKKYVYIKVFTSIIDLIPGLVRKSIVLCLTQELIFVTYERK